MTIVTSAPKQGFFDDDGQAGALKLGLFGFGGTGKTYTAALAIIAAREVLGLAGPLAMFDTEGGSVYIRPIVEELTGHKLLVKRARDLQSLIDFGKQCEITNVAGAIVDSITHPWRELCDSYLKQINTYRVSRKWNLLDKLEFQHWGPIKDKWSQFPDFYLNSPLSIAICGRAGYEYENEVNVETKRKELTKTGVKMKTEGEMGYEPSVLVLMEAEQDLDADRTKETIVHRTATVLKDRFRDLDGKCVEFRNMGSVRADYEAVKTFFGPHLDRLRSGSHSQVNLTNKTHFDLNPQGEDQWQHEKREREILCEQIQHAMLNKWPSQTGGDKKGRLDCIQDVFGKASWAYVETLDSGTLRRGFERITRIISGEPEPEPTGGNTGTPARADAASDEVPDFAPVPAQGDGNRAAAPANELPKLWRDQFSAASESPDTKWLDRVLADAKKALPPDLYPEIDRAFISGCTKVRSAAHAEAA